MDSQAIEVGDPRSLRACQVRVLCLTQFLEKDWSQESHIWLMNSTLQLAEATAMLARKEVEAAAESGIVPQPQPFAEIPLVAEAYKDRAMALTHQLWQEQQPEQRATLALALAEATAILARLQGAEMTGAIAIP